MRAPLFVAALLLTAGSAHGASALARLADALADQIAAVAKDRAVELAVPEDRTGRGGALALDLRALVAARLEGRVALHDTGQRLRVVSVLSETPHRLVASARVVEDPGGRLVDLLSASVEDDAPLAFSPERTPPPGLVLDVLSVSRTPPIDASVLDLALLGAERVAVLSSEALDLYRWDGAALVPESRHPLPGPLATVRAPGGRIVATKDDDSSLWVLTSRSPKAVLFGLRGGRLTRLGDAAALPWPGCPGGLRYRSGTNFLEGTIGGLGPGPFLALVAADREMAVSVEGELRLATAGGPTLRGPRVGPALAPLWQGCVAASSADPPGSRDAILVLAEADGALRVLDTIPVEGALRALAARTQGDTARLVAAVEEPGGAKRLLLMDVRRREP